MYAGGGAAPNELGDISTRVGPKRAKIQSTLGQFVASPEQVAAFNRNMAMACITSCVPFNFFENKYLQAAAQGVGVKLCSRKVLATTLLDSIFDAVELGTVDSLAKLRYIDAASDGWRKKHCEMGAGLMNFCALRLTDALFWDALNCSDLRKDGLGIANLLEEQALAMTAGDPKRFVGFILDNTKANWTAMQILETRHTYWIMRGCIGHGLSLAMKDFTVFTRGAYFCSPPAKIPLIE